MDKRITRRRQRVDRYPDKYGCVKLTIDLYIPEEVYIFLNEKCEENSQSWSSLVSVLTKKHKKNLEKLRL